MKEKLLDDVKHKMDQSVVVLQRELTGIRTGRANPALVEHLPVDAYGTKMPLNQLATITAPEARLLVVQPWDKTLVSAITNAFTTSDLGLNPQSDGVVLRVPIPALSQERRVELTKLAAKKAEESRVAVRNIRREAIEQLRKAKKDGDISEDDERRLEEQMQKLTDQHIVKIDDALKAKDAEILQS